MFTTDAHCDTLFEIAIKGRRPEDCCVTPARLHDGCVSIQTFAMFTSYRNGHPYEDGLAMKAAFKRLPLPQLRGQLPEEMPTETTAILACEGGEMLKGDLNVLADFDDDVRLRLLTLTWNFENEIGTAAKVNATDGLKPFGIELLHEMDRRGICADVSHLNEAGFWDVIRHTKLPPVASHSNCRWLCDVPRNLWKDQVKAIIERGGFIGINLYSDFLAKDGRATLEDVLRNIDEICSMGGEDVVGFGSDFDGIDVWPDGLDNPDKLPGLLELLEKRGYSREQLEKIAGRNYWRVLKTAERMSGRYA